MNRKITFTNRALLLLAITFITTVSVYAQQVINTTLQHDGKTRQYRLYIPQSYDSNTPAPLILNFHGFTNTINIQYNQSDFQQLAEDNQFIFVTPQGLGGFFSGWAINNSFGGNEDDLGFSDALINKIQSDFNINEKRIYATGFSNGGFFSYRLACELSSRIAAVASVAGSMTRSWIDNNQCQPQHPTAVLQITGTNDGTISINGNGSNKPILDVMEYWANYNNADATPEIIQLGGGSTRAIWDNGDNGVTAEFITVQGKGHSWNGGNVNTSQEIWNFFSRFDIDGALDPSPPTGETCSGNVSSFPYSESFEGTIGAWEQATADDLNWTVNAGGTPSTGTGPNSAIDGTSYIYVEASGNGTGYPTKRAILNSPCLDLSSLSTAKLGFQYHMLGATIGTLSVEARTNNAGDWETIFSKSGAQGSDWNAIIIDLDAYAGNDSVQLRINTVTGSNYTGDVAIDAIQIGAAIDGPVTAECTGDISNFPNTESFETNIGDWAQETSVDDLDWTRDSGGTPSTGTGPSSGADGNFYLYVEASGDGTGFPNKRAILNSPCLDFSALDSPTLAFQYHMVGSAIKTLDVEARINNSGEWTSVFNKTGAQGTGWNQANLELSSYAGEGSVQLRFNAVTGSGSSGWQSDIAIDAVSIQNGTVDPPSTCATINFDNFQIIGFSNQDAAGNFTASGTTLSLQNNTWKYIALNYTVTANTVISFDFNSTSEGEIHGVGFENDNTLTPSRYFKVYGTQNYGVTNFDNYSGSGTKTYTIPVGNFYSGNADRLVFINDNDVGSGNNSLFSNVRIYEGACDGLLSAKDVIAKLDNKIALIGNEDEGIGVIEMIPNPTRDQFSLTVSSKSTKDIRVSIYTILGQKKYEGRLNPGVNNLSANNLALSSGIYVVKIQSEGDKAVVKKLIIE
ncbi:T9SS type A sorting domain-containing protein [Lacinutrix sp. Hel_I_90]|uniref:T9SS type A sorting domain-containing protein n=1 Tax=Lacinutrix sp. Hel_I_90 TaxID=1249999 RepID=UPI0005CADAE7|nr:T9SS type A sorting domain-containing protein [Lacinutrix sp. Hel_I_90]